MKINFMKKLKNTISMVLLGVGLIGMQYSCEIQENFEYVQGPDNSKLSVDALTFISENESLSLLKEAIIKAGMESYYNGSKEYTFIAPNNQAFTAYLKDNGYASINDIPLPILKNMLKYHILNGTVNFNDPALSASNKPIAYNTENGQTMFLSHSSTYVGIINEGTNSQWQIRTSNLVPTNGVMHVTNFITYYSAPTGDANAVNPNLLLDTIFPKHDSYINGGIDSDKNFGTTNLLKIKNVSGNGDYDRKAVMIFDFNDFKKEGVVTDLRMQLSVSFTHAKGVDLNLFETPNASWTEASIKFNNMVFPTSPRIASIKTSKVSFFNFDITDYYKNTNPEGLKSFMLDGQPGSDETDEIASKEHATLLPPMIIATLASGDSELTLENITDFKIENGGVYVLSKDNLEVSGASAGDIIYTIEEAPVFGWLLKGAEVLKKGSKFSQLDLDLKNLLFIHDGEQNGTQTIKLTARDRAGAILENLELKITVE